ncbi:pyruvate formate lyase activating enzyme [Hydrogenoanaerobacterium saccharovorans]|uniref:Pyruvate formate lyase activating enzyme n=1 Tax=Hydrogenoanaerobacterium saccharovorans TaxID=474960 RepID=A0A1H7ZAP3_9FIRM|nr:glycyl-radical enzyme activating protein [Hydrogenoanaerobacterium saccharovorans]RPF48768.1 pyruvate formate lyase activating enzyme [Hydrogenoanaerobacterium saccharovorans]SEM54628.1 pyruvate formate lyase activating enzyme [Hydrogenoanaerobacterium saccharovorans]
MDRFLSPKIQGLVFDIHRGTTHDGPGMRTTAFFKGCPLRCNWCQNPESISAHAIPVWNEKKCIGCGLCVESCTNQAISLSTQGVLIDRTKCQSCFACTKECPTGAIKQTGILYDVSTLADELCKDKIFFDEFEGGVTISGGEPALQPDFLFALLQELKQRGVHTALDTCGLCSSEVLLSLMPVTDVFLYDIKLSDWKQHFFYTGVDNSLILENFKTLCTQVIEGKSNCRIWVRTPLIPRATATEENIQAIGTLLSPFHNVIERWELCSFNNVCKDKYRQLRKDWEYRMEPLMLQTQVDYLGNIAQKVFPAEKVVISGLTAK